MFTLTQKRVIALSSLGGALEFYDFVVFVFLAKLLGELFFPATNPVAAVMASMVVFAIGYLARPLGGIIFGHFGDKFGRKVTFVATVLLMAIPTFLIGLLPTYHSVGILASILLVTLRLLQGLSVGGEIPGAIVFIAESVPVGKRGFATGLIFLGVNMGLLVGSFVSALLSEILTHQQLIEWGWRLPFLLGGSLGVISFYLRKQLTETAFFQQIYQQHAIIKLPIKEVLSQFLSPLMPVTAFATLQALIVSITVLFFPTYLSTFFHFPLPKLLVLNTFNILIFAIPVLLVSYFSDRFGRKKLMMVGILFFILAVYPLFSLFEHQSFPLVIMVSLACGFFGSFIGGTFPCMSAELFPTTVRYTAVALSYNFGFGIVGGLSPLLAMSLIHRTGNLIAPSWILIVGAILALVAWLFTRETYRSNLTEVNYNSR